MLTDGGIVSRSKRSNSWSQFWPWLPGVRIPERLRISGGPRSHVALRRHYLLLHVPIMVDAGDRRCNV